MLLAVHAARRVWWAIGRYGPVRQCRISRQAESREFV